MAKKVTTFSKPITTCEEDYEAMFASSPLKALLKVYLTYTFELKCIFALLKSTSTAFKLKTPHQLVWTDKAFWMQGETHSRTKKRKFSCLWFKPLRFTMTWMTGYQQQHVWFFPLNAWSLNTVEHSSSMRNKRAAIIVFSSLVVLVVNSHLLFLDCLGRLHQLRELRRHPNPENKNASPFQHF